MAGTAGGLSTLGGGVRVLPALEPAGPAAATESSKNLEVPVGLQEAWGKRMAIKVADGPLRRAEAERLAWAGLQPQRDPR